MDKRRLKYMKIRKFIIHNSLARSAKLCLFIILLIATALRLWGLGTIPPHLTPDEASLGYNAYSILKTGRDEYGELLPIIFKSFGDYKPGLYVYLTVPFVALFGLTEFAVRLPSALAGIIAVWLLYKVVLLLFAKQKNRSPITDHRSLASVASLLLAISPWHIHFSRGAWEANVSLTLTLAGIYLFLRSFKNHRFLIASSLLFSLTFLTYQGAKLSTIILLVVLTISFWKHCKKLVKENTTTVVQSTVVGLILISPILFSLFQGRTGRLEVFSVFSYRRPTEELQAFLDQGGNMVGDLTYYLYHSEKLNFERGILGRWFNHFSGRFLFFEGDWQNPRHSAPNHGMLLLVDIVLLIVGFVGLVRLKGKAQVFIFLWL
ncbi:glycosyltransferase family 39 protein, partial [Patescibacteria group bacterium]|nr:glycosyltransferase family 39 protein [Patescibacteria group bacterium]